jgi:hypothetical protein
MVNRVKANQITITVDGDDYSADLSSIMLQSEDAATDVTTFADATAGGSSDWFIELSGITSTDLASFWRVCWNNAGDEVPFVLTSSSALASDFTGTLRIPAQGRLPFGGDASADGTFSWSGVRFEVVGAPVLATV